MRRRHKNRKEHISGKAFLKISLRKNNKKKPQSAFRSIRWKLTGIISLILIAVVSLLTWMHISVQKKMMEEELRKRSVIMKQFMTEQGKSFAVNLGIQVEKDIAAYNFSGVTESVTEGVKKYKDIKYAVLISASGTVFVHTLYPDYIRKTLTDQRNLKALNQHRMAVFEYPEKEGLVTEIVVPVQISTEPWGCLRVVYTQNYLNAEIRYSEKQIAGTIRTMVMRSLLTSCALIFICFLGIFLFSRQFTTPLRRLTASARRISNGDFSLTEQIAVPTKDEVGMLADAFRDMTLKLEASYQKLAEYNQTLEQRVTDRTIELRHKNAALSQVNRKLEQTLKKLQESQTQLIQSEKMAALGQLIAGIAHEINNPLGVVRGAAQNIFLALDASFSGLPLIFQHLPDELHPCLSGLLQQIIGKEKNFSTRESRKMRRAMTAHLKKNGIAQAEVLSEMMTDMGLSNIEISYMPLLRWQGAADVLKTLYSIYSLKEDGQNILTAVERASKIVFALKKYSHHDPKGRKILTDIPDCIETVLTLYHNRIRHGIEIIRHYEDVPQIFCYRDELNQVWTNLIHNALQAMVYKGSLEIRVSGGKDFLLISIADDGEGIPPEIQEKVFEPFFTTKNIGEGSGLGLDICRKIIQKHQGNIQFESQPGKTVFTVWLPMINEEREQKGNGHV